MGSLASLMVVFLAASSAAPEAPLDPNVILQVSTPGDRYEFRIGETIPIQLSFSAAAKGYQVNQARYDRSGRMEYEHFAVSPANGAVDPLANRRHGTIGGGLSTSQFLRAEPWTLTVNLNEWVRFQRPGEYRLTVSSRRVSVKDVSKAGGEAPVTARARPLKLRIVPASRAWQRKVLDEAVASLDEPRPVPTQRIGRSEDPRREALETLRFLGTPEALRELAKRMRGEDEGGGDYTCMLGLLYSPDPEAARRALDEALADPDQPIGGMFLSTLEDIRPASKDGGDRWRPNQRVALEELLEVLPSKRGQAFTVSLSTAVGVAMDGAVVPKERLGELVQQLVSRFDELPESAQTRFLFSHRWHQVAGPALLPILRRHAQNYREFPNLRASPAYESLRLSERALGLWYEMDPSGARPAIIEEIKRPRPRFDARVLGVLPEKTLPEVESTLAEHLASCTDPYAASLIASLIARYATDSILPTVLGKLDALTGEWVCATQAPLLGYVLRVSPATAGPRIEQALAARTQGTRCYRDLFRGVSETHYDPVLEEIGLLSLYDPDLQVAAQAATMLGRFGSPAVESALWRRYASWSAKWAGREDELVVLFAERAEDRQQQLALGYSLVEALATGRSWLSDEAKLRRLEKMTTVRRLRDDLGNHLRACGGRPIGISVIVVEPPHRLMAHVAHYMFDDLGPLAEKLGQFPPGTEFQLQVGPPASPGVDEVQTKVREILAAHGLVLAEAGASP